MRTLLRVFFHLLYHPFSFAYDMVAAVVSLGHWQEWVFEVVPFIAGTRTLEIGHGPGHLHRFLLRRGLTAVAMDESAAMSRLARRRLSEVPAVSFNLVRGLAQTLPFREGAFETVIATFPAEYITDSRTLSEVRRCLSDGGRFIVLPAALPRNKFLARLFRVTGQAPSDAVRVIREKLQEPLLQSEFDAKIHLLERSSGTLIVVVANKK